MNRLIILFVFFWIALINGAALPIKDRKPNYLLSITAYEQLVELALDGNVLPVDFNRTWDVPMLVSFTDLTRLVAFTAIARSDTEDEGFCFGALASVNENYFTTSAESCKCTNNGGPSYARLGFDDSDWRPAAEYGCNACTDVSCFNDTVRGIVGTAQWIWTDRSGVGEVAYCRCYLPMCEINNPCQNGGQCLPNSQNLCSCPENFSGVFCQTDESNPCLNFPCKNGGTCMPINDETGEFRCNCAFGYTGSDCTTKVEKLRLDVTAKEFLGAIYVDGVHIETVDNPTQWNKTMSIDIPYTSRLLALAASNINNTCAGLIASTDFDYFLTDISWRCTNAAKLGWTDLNYDDNAWDVATIVGNNINGIVNCSGNVTSIPAISSKAYWIWRADDDLTIYCRGYLPVCKERPCLNGGICQQKEGELCLCVPGFYGVFCENYIEYPLSITANEDLEELYIDGSRMTLKHSTEYRVVDTFKMHPTTRLIAAVAHDVNGLSGGCRGILGSVTYEGLITNVNWKCSYDAKDGWFAPGFNDSEWHAAFELGTNTNGEESRCPGVIQPIPQIFANASWIWANPDYLVAFCRGYLSICSHKQQPCQHGGTCSINGGTLCSCPEGYTGTYCEYVIGVDVPYPINCNNHGVATEISPGVYVCQCYAGYTGNKCEIVNCLESSCLNGGTCSIEENEIKCQCAEGFTGNKCEISEGVKFEKTHDSI